MPSDIDGSEVKVKVLVEYAQLPLSCSICEALSHSDFRCANNPSAQPRTQPTSKGRKHSRSDPVKEPEPGPSNAQEDNLNEDYVDNMGMVPYVVGNFFGADVVMDEDQIQDEIIADDPKSKKPRIPGTLVDQPLSLVSKRARASRVVRTRSMSPLNLSRSPDRNPGSRGCPEAHELSPGPNPKNPGSSPMNPGSRLESPEPNHGFSVARTVVPVLSPGYRNVNLNQSVDPQASEEGKIMTLEPSGRIKGKAQGKALNHPMPCVVIGLKAPNATLPTVKSPVIDKDGFTLVTSKKSLWLAGKPAILKRLK